MTPLRNLKHFQKAFPEGKHDWKSPTRPWFEHSGGLDGLYFAVERISGVNERVSIGTGTGFIDLNNYGTLSETIKKAESNLNDYEKRIKDDRAFIARLKKLQKAIRNK